MEIDFNPPTIVCDEPFAHPDYLRSLDCDRQQVAAYQKAGHFSKENIYKVLTNKLLRFGRYSDEGKPRIPNVKRCYARLLDGEGNFSPKLLFNFIQDHVPPPGFPHSEHATQALCDLLIWHSAWPFPVEQTSLGTPIVNKAAFIRAINQLTPAPGYNAICKLRGPLQWTTLGHSIYNPRGMWLSTYPKRAAGPQDYRRRLFRSLAEPRPEVRGSGQETEEDESKPAGIEPFLLRIPVACTELYGRVEKRKAEDEEERTGNAPSDSDEEDLEWDWDTLVQKVLYVRYEDEQTTDVLDMLARVTRQETSPGIATPNQVAHDFVLPSLPVWEHGLNELRLSVVKLTSLLRLLGAVYQRGWMSDSDGDTDEDVTEAEEKRVDVIQLARTVEENAVGRDGDDGFLSWEEFDKILEPEAYTADISDALNEIFRVFENVGSPIF